MNTRTLLALSILAVPLTGCPETQLSRLNFGSTAIVTGDFDTISKLVQEAAVDTNVEATIAHIDGYIDGPRYESDPSVQPGQLATQVEDFLRGDAAEGLLSYETVFFSDGMRGCNEVVYNGVAEDNHLVLDQTVLANLDRAVRAGGARMWFSDWTYDLMEATWPELVDWVGDDEEIDAAQRGIAPQTVNATITNPDLAAALEVPEGSQLELIFDFGAWAVAESVDESVDVLLAADVEYDDPVTGERVVQEDAPLLLSAPIGQGIVLFTAFHNDAQISDETRDVLRFGLGQLSR